MQADTDARIRQRAYEIWLREGRPHGRDKDHWALAQSELAAENSEAQGNQPAQHAAKAKPAARSTRRKAAPEATTQAMATGAAEGGDKTPAKPQRPRQPRKK